MLLGHNLYEMPQRPPLTLLLITGECAVSGSAQPNQEMALKLCAADSYDTAVP